MYYTVYKTINKVNNKIYVGTHVTEDPNDDYLGSGKLLLRAIKKYGVEKFKKVILAECSSSKEMFKVEKEIVTSEFIAREDTYNLIRGGEGGFSYINKNNLNNSAENNVKGGIGQRLKCQTNFEYLSKKKKLSSKIMKRTHREGKFRYDTFTGKSHTEETKKKMSEAKKGKCSGKDNSQYGTCWIYNEDLQENKKVPKADLTDWIKSGWILGRKMSFYR
jgi:hypothetical protein